MFIFYSISVTAFFFAYIAEKKSKAAYLLLSDILLSLLCGLRGEDVGTDTHTYIMSIETVMSGGVHFDFDMGFHLLIKFLTSITNSIPLTLTTISFITISLCYITFWHYRSKGSLSLMVFIFICLFYPQMFNIVRQMLALSIVFVSTLLLEKKKNVLFCLVLAIATFIHLSSFVCIGIFLMYIIRNIKSKLLLFFIFAIIIVGFVISYGTISALYEARFAYMQDQYQTTLGYEVIAQLILVGFIIFSNYKRIKKNPEFVRLSSFCVIGILLSIITANAGEASRIAYFYTVFETLFATVLLRQMPNKNLGYLGFIFLGLLNFVFRVSVSGWYGIYPYYMTNI